MCVGGGGGGGEIRGGSLSQEHSSHNYDVKQFDTIANYVGDK